MRQLDINPIKKTMTTKTMYRTPDCEELSKVVPIKVKIQRAHSVGDPNQHTSGMQTDIWTGLLCKGTILSAADDHRSPHPTLNSEPMYHGELKPPPQAASHPGSANGSFKNTGTEASWMTLV